MRPGMVLIEANSREVMLVVDKVIISASTGSTTGRVKTAPFSPMARPITMERTSIKLRFLNSLLTFANFLLLCLFLFLSQIFLRVLIKGFLETDSAEVVFLTLVLRGSGCLTLLDCHRLQPSQKSVVSRQSGSGWLLHNSWLFLIPCCPV